MAMHVELKWLCEEVVEAYFRMLSQNSPVEAWQHNYTSACIRKSVDCFVLGLLNDPLSTAYAI
jgi:hypothetical protein